MAPQCIAASQNAHATASNVHHRAAADDCLEDCWRALSRPSSSHKCVGSCRRRRNVRLSSSRSPSCPFSRHSMHLSHTSANHRLRSLDFSLAADHTNQAHLQTDKAINPAVNQRRAAERYYKYPSSFSSSPCCSQVNDYLLADQSLLSGRGQAAASAFIGSSRSTVENVSSSGRRRQRGGGFRNCSSSSSSSPFSTVDSFDSVGSDYDDVNRWPAAGRTPCSSTTASSKHRRRQAGRRSRTRASRRPQSLDADALAAIASRATCPPSPIMQEEETSIRCVHLGRRRSSESSSSSSSASESSDSESTSSVSSGSSSRLRGRRSADSIAELLSRSSLSSPLSTQMTSSTSSIPPLSSSALRAMAAAAEVSAGTAGPQEDDETTSSRTPSMSSLPSPSSGPSGLISSSPSSPLSHSSPSSPSSPSLTPPRAGQEAGAGGNSPRPSSSSSQSQGVEEIRVCTHRTCRKEGSATTLQLLRDLCPPNVSVESCGCLGRCGSGPNLVFVPTGMVVSHCGSAAHVARLLERQCGVSDPDTNLRALDLKNQAIAAQDNADVARAHELLSQAISINPSAGLHLLMDHRASTRIRLGDLQGALEDAHVAAQLAPTWSAPYLRMAEAQLALGRLDDVAASYEQAVRVDPSLARSKSFQAKLASLKRRLSSLG